MFRRAALAAMCALCMHCPHKEDPAKAGVDAGASASADAPEVILDANAQSDACTLGHLGALLDLPARDHEPVEREGARWARVSGQRLTLKFAGPTDVPAGPIAVDVRARGGAAKRLIFTLNGKLLGDVGLIKGESRILHGSSTQGAQLTQGTNELVVRFSGVSPKSTEAAAEIDWIHVGAPEEGTTYVAPTFDDALGTQSIGGTPRRGYAIRGPGYLRCSGALPERATLEAQIGVLGDGESDVEARVLRDRAPPLVLGRAHARGGEPWRSLSLPVDLPARALGAIELAIVHATPGARVVLAEARLVTREAPPRAPPATARNVVLVVLGSSSPRALGSAAELGKLADAGVRFEANRASSTWPSSSLASMLTGLTPRAHGAGERTVLDPTLVTVADAAKQGGVSAAFFTANPTTGADHGFARPFATFLSAMPGNGPSTGVMDEAARFFREHEGARLLMVVHARGAHPPWDASADDLKRLPPEGYTGPIDPAHAGELLARAKRTPPQLRLSDADRARVAALQARAVEAHDAALGKLLAAIDDTKHAEDTLVIVTSDVGASDRFLSDGDPLDEQTLAIPLVLRGPGAPPRSRSDVPTSSIDVARTILGALGLAAPKTMEGLDVRALPRAPRPLVASVGDRWSSRLLGFVASGDDRHRALCDLIADPACATDAEPQSPLAAEILRRVDLGPARRAEPAYPSPATVTALRAWGR